MSFHTSENGGHGYAFSYLRLHAANRVIARSATTKQSPLAKRGKLLPPDQVRGRNDMSARSLAPRKWMVTRTEARRHHKGW